MTLLPFGDPSRGRRLVKVLGWLAGIAVLVAVLELFGVDVDGWFGASGTPSPASGSATSWPAGRCRRCRPR